MEGSCVTAAAAGLRPPRLFRATGLGGGAGGADGAGIAVGVAAAAGPALVGVSSRS